MRFNTGLRSWANRRIEKIGSVDLLLGIPCFNNDGTVGHVIHTASEGLYRHYPDAKTLIIISDGGSTDDTREAAKEQSIRPYIEKLVTIYRGLPGKGSALRMIFEAASFLEAKATILLDADLRSVTPDWVPSLAEPVLTHGHDFAAPMYSRYKYDATITNNIAYNLTRALFGKRIRQPIGGDFGLSARMIRYFYGCDPDIWMSDIARFGVDIWMTLSALLQDVSICQAYLGTKIHDAKDPVENLGPMFRQVVHPIFQLMEDSAEKWRDIRGSQPIPSYGNIEPQEPQEFAVDLSGMIQNYQEGFKNFSPLWKTIINADSYATLKKLSKNHTDENFKLSTQDWARIVYDFAATFHHWSRNRGKLVEIMRPLYYARVASFINETGEMTTEQAEIVIDKQAEIFEDLKPYLLGIWNE